MDGDTDLHGESQDGPLGVYSVERFFLQGTKNNLSLLSKLFFEGCKGDPFCQIVRCSPLIRL